MLSIKRIFISIISLLIMGIMIDSITPILAQETSIEEVETSLSSEQDTLETRSEEELTTFEELRIQTTDTEYFKAILPYIYFLNYQYVATGESTSNKDVIMEFMPDENGIFQVAEFTDSEATAYIYQVRQEGLYELAYFTNYLTVEDLRYSNDASDNIVSLVLPVNLEIGQQFKSGYQKEINKRVVDRVESVKIGEDVYRDVLVIEEESNGTHLPLRQYYAKEVGLVLIEQIDSVAGSKPILYLNATQGPLMN